MVHLTIGRECPRPISNMVTNMTVSDLMTALAACDPNATVVITTGDVVSGNRTIGDVSLDNLRANHITEVGQGPIHMSPDGNTYTVAMWIDDEAWQ